MAELNKLMKWVHYLLPHIWGVLKQSCDKNPGVKLKFELLLLFVGCQKSLF